MTKSTITRERLEQLADNNTICKVSWDERIELARIALAAMDSESGCLPLDYLQGHKDGLEWAAQLAEANHPETGDWLYDDPIELAKAIRKGPDMPPVQPVEGSEPDRNPVLAYADSYRDMAKQGVESVPIWSVITDLERNIAPLYRHAQPAPVVPDKMPSNLRGLIEAHTDRLFDDDGAQEIWNACRAAMLQAGTLINEGTIQAGNSPVITGAEQRIADAVELLQKAAPAMLADNSGPDGPLAGRLKSPAIPDGYVMVPKEPTQAMCAAFNDSDYGRKSLRERYVAMLAAADCSIPMISDRWVPVSERMPEEGGRYWCYVEEQNSLGKSHYQWNCSWNGDRWWVESEGGGIVTHWMPLPAAPQEVNNG